MKEKSKCNGFNFVNFLSHAPRPCRAASLCCALCNPFSNSPPPLKPKLDRPSAPVISNHMAFYQIIWIFGPQSPLLTFSQPSPVSFPSARNRNHSWDTKWIKQVPSITALWAQQAVTELQRGKMSKKKKKKKKRVFALISSKSLSMSIKIQPALENSVFK